VFNGNRHVPNELRLTRIQMEEIEENARFTAQMRVSPELGELKSAIWFVPNFPHALKGGLRTVFMLAERLSEQWGTENFIVIDNFYNQVIKGGLKEQLQQHFPKLQFTLINLRHDDHPSSLPAVDAGFCTLWVTAYTLAKYRKCKAKFYIAQDYEPLFYVSGSISAIIEHTYRLGFYVIANTPGVASRVSQYSDWIMNFVPGVDRNLYYSLRPDVRKKGPFTIVYYGRPGNERNCFVLGCEALRRVKEAYGSKVRIISVGADYSLARYGLGNVFENRGLLKSMEEVAALYREADMGVSLMSTPHPSYQPLEYMASGCPAVTNINELNAWLYRDGHNIILSEPIINIMADRIVAALKDVGLRQRVKEGGLETVEKLSWDDAMESIMQYIRCPQPSVIGQTTYGEGFGLNSSGDS
jgi:glycosyltransferase involved in cell wall biosynthesis